MVVLCRSQQTTFHGAVTMLKEAVGRLFPENSRSKKRTISDVKKGKGNRGGVAKEYNGVDTSDLTRWYAKEELAKLPKWVQKKIVTNKNHRSKNKEKINALKRAKISSTETDSRSGSTSSLTSESENRVVAAVINGMHRAAQNSSSSNSTQQGNLQFPLNGRSATVSAASRNNRQSQ